MEGPSSSCRRDGSDNIFVVIESDEDDPVWTASFAVLDDSGWEVIWRDGPCGESGVTIEEGINLLAHEPTIRMDARRPTNFCLA